MRAIAKVVLILVALLMVAIFVLLRDGDRITPYGQGVVELEGGKFEAFALPDYAEAVIDDAYKSYDALLVDSIYWFEKNVEEFDQTV